MTKKQQSSNDLSDFRFFDSDFSYWKNIEIMKYFDAIESSNSMRKILNNGEVEFDRPFFTASKKKLRNLSVYKNYSECIDAFTEIVGLPDHILKDRDKELKRTWKGKAKFVI